MLHMWRGGIGYGVLFMGLQLNLKFGICEYIWEPRRIAFRVFLVQGFLDRLFWTCLAYFSMKKRALIRPATTGSAPLITIISEGLAHVDDINHSRLETDWVPVPSEELHCQTDIESAYGEISLIRHVVLLEISPPILSASQRPKRRSWRYRIPRFFRQHALRDGSYDARINSSW